MKYILLLLVTLTGCVTKYAAPPLPPLPQKFHCEWDEATATYRIDEGCAEIIRNYDAARGVNDD